MAQGFGLLLSPHYATTPRGRRAIAYGFLLQLSWVSVAPAECRRLACRNFGIELGISAQYSNRICAGELAPDADAPSPASPISICDSPGYRGELKQRGAIEGWRLTRRKLGFGPRELGEFHIAMETRDLAQLDRAFTTVATRTEPMESFHFAVNSKVQNLTIALYRDFPDEVRQEGEEKF